MMTFHAKVVFTSIVPSEQYLTSVCTPSQTLFTLSSEIFTLALLIPRPQRAFKYFL